ncbi:MAG: tRNA pseudouridine(55) synthase TruB [candidate division NC10 bacterium]|nr:tRNA pseudouridine(55) synthase TruB [candidate division NC10 bacterium]MBI4391075.1 tRNA pseudouridine(55) synthase TruB [candidate division NC10 bacterium]
MTGRRERSGVLNVNKSAGMTSHDVVDAVRRLYGMRRVGHTGTLDPQGTGVLPICLGRATKIAQYLMAADKEYQLTMRLGVTTDTLDAEGKVVAEADWSGVAREELEATLARFKGEIQQVPPLFSAKKVQGERLYRLARRGQVVERAPVTVMIYDVKCTAFDPPEVGLWVWCGKGMYARSLCDDIGRVLSCGAHLARLTRTRSGRFELKDALTLTELAERVESGRGDETLIPVAEALAHLPAVRVAPEATAAVLHGGTIPAAAVVAFPPEIRKGALVRVLGFRRQLLSLARAALDSADFPSTDPRRSVLTPVRVFSGTA